MCVVYRKGTYTLWTYDIATPEGVNLCKTYFRVTIMVS